MSWMTRGKTIAQLIAELQSFEDQDLVVELSVDDGATRHPISLVERTEDACLLLAVDN
jgi:hypothetical protein